MGWSSSWWLGISLVVRVGANLGEAPSVANFCERWPLAYFALLNRYFGLLGGGEIRSGAEGSQIVEGRHLLPIPGEGGLQPIVCCQPARSGEGHFLVVYPELFLAVSPGLFFDNVVRNFVSWFRSWLSWLCDQGIVHDSDRSLQSSSAAQQLREPVKITTLVPGVRYQLGIRVYWLGKSEVKGQSRY